jgi:hypothetical protein
MFYTEKQDPHIGKPIFNPAFLQVFYNIENHLLYFLSEYPSLMDSRPLIVTLVEVIPIHFIHSDCEHFLVLLIDPFFNDAVINKFIYIDSRCVPKIENERMPEGLGSNVVGPIFSQQIKKFFVDRVSIKKIFLDSLFDFWMIFDQNSLAA